jgi:hypothetical protein
VAQADQDQECKALRAAIPVSEAKPSRAVVSAEAFLVVEEMAGQAVAWALAWTIPWEGNLAELVSPAKETRAVTEYLKRLA